MDIISLPIALAHTKYEWGLGRPTLESLMSHSLNAHSKKGTLTEWLARIRVGFTIANNFMYLLEALSHCHDAEAGYLGRQITKVFPFEFSHHSHADT